LDQLAALAPLVARAVQVVERIDAIPASWAAGSPAVPVV
jgi:hypothetical protein